MIFWQNTYKPMMPEISLNILDVVQNSIRAQASEIEISVSVRTGADELTVWIQDNGCGMTAEQVEKVQDPFFTTRTTRKVGLGIPFFRQAAEGTGGSFQITSAAGTGTIVEAIFGLSHIDRMPLGDITATIHTLIIFNEMIRFKYTYSYDERQFTLDTKEIREIVGTDISFKAPEISAFIKAFLAGGKEEADGGVSI